MTSVPDTIDVTIIFPCLNEIRTLGQCIEEAQTALTTLKESDGLTGEILVADNGSTDGSVELARELNARVISVEKKGYGNALISGCNYARGRYLVMADSDASYDLRECVPMVRALVDGYDLCMGSRFKGEIMPGAMPWKNQYIGNPVLSGILNLLFDSGLSDAHCGMRAFTKSSFEKMRLTSSGMEFASEMVIKATLLDIKRTEVPITLRPDGRDRAPHLRPFRDGWRHLRYLLMLSPMWLYFVPAFLLGAIGAIIFLILILNPEQRVVDFGAIWFGNHWMIISGALLVGAHQAILFGLATTLYGIIQKYRHPKRWMIPIYRVFNLEQAIVLGLLFIISGLLILLAIFASWSAEGFGALGRIREISAAATLALIGLQHFFGGFLLAVIAGNDASVHEMVVSKLRMKDITL